MNKEKRTLYFYKTYYPAVPYQYIARKNYIKYEINASLNERDANGRPVYYYVIRRAARTVPPRTTLDWEYLSTENIRRFASIDEAMQFCCDMHEGKVDIDALIEEYKAELERQQKVNIMAEIKEMEELINSKNLSLIDFVELTRRWERVDERTKDHFRRENNRERTKIREEALKKEALKNKKGKK